MLVEHQRAASVIGAGMITPRFAYATHELALIARDLRDMRASGDPKAVAEGKLSQADADDRLRIANALAADWTAYDELVPPPATDATEDEKLTMLTRSLAVIIVRRDKARTAMVHEDATLGRHDLGALWQLVDQHVPQTNRIEAYLHWESYAAAIEALLWWQRRTGSASKRFAVEVTIAAREMRQDTREAA